MCHRDNIYTHRKPKKMYEDDVMVCQCKPASSGGVSCQHDDCLNGMLNIECVAGFCDCGKECRNQRFQRRQYARFEVRRAGLKGMGLFAKELIKKGSFIVEYVGEVLDEEEYLRRKDYYFSVGQRHYYFMNIGNGEVSGLVFLVYLVIPGAVYVPGPVLLQPDPAQVPVQSTSA